MHTHFSSLSITHSFSLSSCSLCPIPLCFLPPVTQVLFLLFLLCQLVATRLAPQNALVCRSLYFSLSLLLSASSSFLCACCVPRFSRCAAALCCAVLCCRRQAGRQLLLCSVLLCAALRCYVAAWKSGEPEPESLEQGAGVTGVTGAGGGEASAVVAEEEHSAGALSCWWWWVQQPEPEQEQELELESESVSVSVPESESECWSWSLPLLLLPRPPR